MMLTKEIFQRQNGKWCIVDPNVSVNVDGSGLIPTWKGNYDTREEAAANARAETAEAYIERIRVALGGYPDSDLPSLATTLKARCGELEEREAMNWAGFS